EREECNRRIGRVHNVTRPAAENCVELVLAAEREACISTVLVTGKTISKIPAPRALANIARQRSDIPDLRCRNSLRSLCEDGVLAPNDVVPAERVERDQPPYIDAVDSAVCRGHLIETFNRSQIHDNIRRDNPLFDKGKQIASTAGKGCGTTFL